MTNKEIGKFIKQARITKGLSQQELAEQMSVAQANVSQWESGTRKLSVENLVHLSKILDIIPLIFPKYTKNVSYQESKKTGDYPKTQLSDRLTELESKMKTMQENMAYIIREEVTKFKASRKDEK